jgi:hypothetical protein
MGVPQRQGTAFSSAPEDLQEDGTAARHAARITAESVFIEGFVS